MTSICFTLYQNILTGYQNWISSYNTLSGLKDQLIQLQHTFDLMQPSNPNYVTTQQQLQQLQGQITNQQNQVTMWQGVVAGLKQQMSDNGCFNQPGAGQ